MDVRLRRYANMVQEYYVVRVREAGERRLEALAGLRTRADVLRLQQETRARIRQSFGPFPPRTPLKARTTGQVVRSRYVIENILFESRPGFLVSANLYLPKHARKAAPSVLGLCGHGENGKAYKTYQAFSQGLALNGFVVLILDPISQGERVQYPNKKARCRLGLCEEHNMIGNQQSLLGEFFGTWRAWDASRASGP